jgi:hypothetical protein
MLVSNKTGLGFGVGEEPLAALFADFGCFITATDMEENEAKKMGWIDSGQHTSGITSSLNRFNICSPQLFEKNVKYLTLDMNNIPDNLGNYDFCWSACALEHLGSIKKGINFIKNSLKTLKHGSLAVHTTEFNVFSDDETLDHNSSYVLFRKKDIIELIDELTSNGHYVWPLDYNIGHGIIDDFVDIPPFSKKDMHLKLLLDKFTSTSIGLIIERR